MDLFGIGSADLSTEEPENVIIVKNRKLHLIRNVVIWAAILTVTVIMCILPFAIYEGTYGFTPDMAAGSYADRDYIDTGDYRFYYFTFEGDWEDGRHWSSLEGWKPIQKHWWGSTVAYDNREMHIITKNNYVVGRLYSIKGKNGYYNLIDKAVHYKADESGTGLVWDIPEELICAESISIHGEEYNLQHGFFFVTQKQVTSFKIGGIWYSVEY